MRSRLPRMSGESKRPRFRGGLLPRRLFLLLLALEAIVGPLLVFRETVRAPLQRISCGRPAPNDPLGDPVIILSVMGRAWTRWDAGDFSGRDDRVFAPYPDTSALGEPWLLPALVGYPWARLSGSLAAGYNVPYFLAAAVACFAAGLLLADLAGAGWAALAGGLLWAWCPGRMNNFGVLGSLWAGFVPLVLLFALRYLRGGRLRDAVAASVSLAVVGLGSSYPLAMGSVVVAVVAVLSARSVRRLLGLGASLAVSLGGLVLVHAPYFRAAREFDVPVGARLLEAQSADVLSVLHTGLFAGPLRDVLETLLPGFPEGAAAFFPTLTVMAVFLVAAVVLPRAPLALRPSSARRRNGPEWRAVRRSAASLLPWLAVAAVAYVASLGPTVRIAGRPLLAGPYRLVAELPGFSGMRGLNRWDQWFGLGLVVAATLLLGRLLRASRPRRGLAALAGLAPLLVLDLWTRPVPSQAVPGPSPFDAWYEELPPDATVAVFPLRRVTADRTWAEQLHHGRRVVNGYQTFPPPIHGWLTAALAEAPFETTFVAFTELGASAVEVDLSLLPPKEASRIEELLRAGALPRARGVVRSASRLLVLTEAVAPILVDSGVVTGLRFDGPSAVLARAPGRLVFRLGSGRVDVEVESASGTTPDVLDIPVVGSDELVATLSRPLPEGAVVRSRGDRREIGRFAPPPPRPSPSG